MNIAQAKAKQANNLIPELVRTLFHFEPFSENGQHPFRLRRAATEQHVWGMGLGTGGI